LIYLYNDDEHGGKNKHFEAAAMRRLKLVPVNTGEFQSAVLMDATDVVEAPDVNKKLSATQKAILEAIDGYENGMSVKAIIESANISQASAYRNLKLLVQSKHLQRDEKEFYFITDEGHEALLW
jgi:predicted transcriptional regulator